MAMNAKITLALLIGLTFISTGFAYDSRPVDYWGDAKEEAPKDNTKKEEKQPQSKSEKKDELQKVMVVENKYESMDDKTLMSLPPEQLLQMSIDAYNQKIKKNLTPIEYAYFKDPNNPKLQEAYRKWIEYQNAKAGQIVNPQIAFALQESSNVSNAINELKKRGYEVLFFYQNDPKSVEMNKVMLMLEQNGIKVTKYSPQSNMDMFKKWNVDAVPTTIFVSKKENKVYKYVGSVSIENMVPLLLKMANK
ncbi:MAG: hypothetical protein JHC31_04525 [Sulfurihydrogenibium sp.]|jgi:hypothetical protein|nr:hypothetical protein [Sulfurihydrogenibium sp.]